MRRRRRVARRPRRGRRGRGQQRERDAASRRTELHRGISSDLEAGAEVYARARSEGSNQRVSNPTSPRAPPRARRPRATACPGPPRTNVDHRLDRVRRRPRRRPRPCPSGVLRAHPATPRRSASRRVESRKKTPCTRPCATTRRRVVSHADTVERMTALEVELDACGGAAAPPSAAARLREVLAEALRTGRAELAKPRSGKDAPVEVAIALQGGEPRRRVPVPAALRADPDAASEREWLLAAAVVGTLVELAEPGPPLGPDDLRLRAGELPGGFLVLALPGDRVRPRASSSSPSTSRPQPIDRLRATALALPPGVIDDVALREPIGARHPLRIAEAVARLGGQPAGAARRARGRRARLLGAGRRGPEPARGPRSRPARGAPDPPAPRRHGQVGRLSHRVRAPRARLRRQRPRARAGGGGGAAGGGAAGGEAVASASATSTSTRARRPRSAS